MEGKNESGLTHEQWGQRQLVLSGRVHVRSSDGRPSPTNTGMTWAGLGVVRTWQSLLAPSHQLYLPSSAGSPSRSPHFCVRDSVADSLQPQLHRLTPRSWNTTQALIPLDHFHQDVSSELTSVSLPGSTQTSMPTLTHAPDVPCRVSPSCSFTVYLPSCKALRCSRHSTNCQFLVHPLRPGHDLPIGKQNANLPKP